MTRASTARERVTARQRDLLRDLVRGTDPLTISRRYAVRTFNELMRAGLIDFSPRDHYHLTERGRALVARLDANAADQ